MTTFTSTRAASTFPTFQSHQSGAVCVAVGSITIATNPVAADIYEMCKVPAGAVVFDGFVIADDLDTGAEALDMDVGWAANGVEALDADGFGNLGTWTGDAVTGVKPEAGIRYNFGNVLYATGPQAFTNETTIQVTAVTAATTGGTGVMTVVAYYYVP